MKKEIKIGALVLSVIVLVSLSIYLYTHEYTSYLIISATLSVIMAIVTANFIITNRSEESMYRSKVNQILKTYDSILVKSNNLPKLEEKNIIRVDTIEDLVDAQMEIRKPIYYQQQTESCSFVLLDNNEACIHIFKLNDQVTNPLEITLKEIELKQNNANKNISEDLSKIDSTAIVEVDNGKYVKVSPVKSDIAEQHNSVEELNPTVPEVSQETKIETPTENTTEPASTTGIVEEPIISQVFDLNSEDKFEFTSGEVNSTNITEENEDKTKKDNDIEVLDF